MRVPWGLCPGGVELLFTPDPLHSIGQKTQNSSNPRRSHRSPFQNQRIPCNIFLRRYLQRRSSPGPWIFTKIALKKIRIRKLASLWHGKAKTPAAESVSDGTPNVCGRLSHPGIIHDEKAGTAREPDDTPPFRTGWKSGIFLVSTHRKPAVSEWARRGR